VNVNQADRTRREERFQTPIIETRVPGSRGEEGILLHAPWREDLAWDLETEIVAVRRRYLPDVGWWVSSSYLDSVISIALRSFPSVLVLGPDEDRLHSRDGRDAVQGRLL
jgi:hypothetical protein